MSYPLTQGREKSSLQRMFPSITILDNNIHHIEMIYNETQRPIRRLIRCILSHSKRTKHSRDQRRIISDLVKHRVIRPILHGIENHFKFDGFSGGRLGNDFDGDEGCVVDVVVGVDCACFGERS